MSWRANLAKNLQELRFVFDQTGPSSAGIREYVLKSYKELKAANPRLPILVREAKGASPKLYARYDFGAERSVCVDGLPAAAVGARLEELAKLGESMPRSAESVGTP